MQGTPLRRVCLRWLGRINAEESDCRSQFVSDMNRIELHERALMDRILNGSETISGLRNINPVSVYLDHPDLSKRDLIIAISEQKLGSGLTIYINNSIVYAITCKA